MNFNLVKDDDDNGGDGGGGELIQLHRFARIVIHWLMLVVAAGIRAPLADVRKTNSKTCKLECVQNHPEFPYFCMAPSLFHRTIKTFNGNI